MHLKSLLIRIAPIVALTTGCAASTYPLNPQLAAEAGVTDQPSYLERVGRDPDGSGAVVQVGACSWYGPGFHGRRTSNGEVFDKNAMTAAHPTLPFGSEVEVTNLSSGNTVRVRINDRGPFVGDRIIDLSYAAAKKLNVASQGVALVKLRLVDIENCGLPETTFAVQVGSFRKESDADGFVKSLNAAQRSAGLYYVKKPDGESAEYRVRFGPFTSEANAKDAAAQLKRHGIASPSVRAEDLARPAVTAQATGRAPGA